MKRLAAAALLMGGIALAQAIVYGPSLAGRKILLPVDLLAQTNRYLPQDSAAREFVPHNPALSDQVFFYEIGRGRVGAIRDEGSPPLAAVCARWT